MTGDELRRELDAGTLRPAYLLSGEEALVRDDALERIRGSVLADGPADFNFDRLEGDATLPGALFDALRTLPVMAQRRLVVLREVVGLRELRTFWDLNEVMRANELLDIQEDAEWLASLKK